MRFNELMGGLDYPMFIVTVTDGDQLAGCLVGFAAQCSIEPARFMVWLSKKNHTYQVASAAEVLAVHVPTQANLDLATLFGTRTGFDVDKFDRCAWRTGPGGVPVLTDCQQWFTGRVLSRFDTGDHEGLLLAPDAVGPATGLGQLGFQQVKHLDAGNEAG
ncbi:MAG TPA: flavin reductase family protein [Actinophytocola sp.]|uniref:flavin reductase family protein n=1 Tax=Actinophytocola sp. TaxID=1872138 RepID=UPI002DBDE9B5|nr:flavin reductase family protein [Actinophytocola sp.]HEU5473505.1 flavin reductase family protein [Actinophytocola sp.]